MDVKAQMDFANYARLQNEVTTKNVKPNYHKYNTEGRRLTDYDDKDSLKNALRCFEKALALASKNEYTKASACHELGVFYFTHFAHLPGAPHSNLNKAVSFFSRAIESKQRQQFPDKHASSLSQLGATYRRAANEHLFPLSRQDCLIKSQQFHESAIRMLEGNIPIFTRLNQLSIAYFNLAATLLDAEKVAETCDAQAKAFQCFIDAIEWAQSNVPYLGLEDLMSLKPHQILPLTFTRLSHFSNNVEHKQLCHFIGEIAPSFGLDPLDFMRVNPYADLSNPIVEIQQLVKEAERNSTAANIEKLSTKIDSLMVSRQSTETDQESDRVSVLIQQANSGLARILVKKEDYLRAFITLENTSGMRFCESASLCWLHPKNPVAQVLLDTLRKLGSTYYGLNELALMSSFVDKDKLHQYLTESAKLLKSQAPLKITNIDEHVFDGNQYASIVDIASRASDPVSYLTQQANLCLIDFKTLGEYTDRLDPDYFSARQRTYQITFDNLKKAVHAHPELVLVKIDIEDHYDDALIIVVYLQNNEIIANGYSFNLPKNLINNVAAFVANNKEASTNWDLDFVDWERILPTHLSKVSLLPSFFASHIPWIATGKVGEKLYQLASEINWLPSLMYLYEQVKYSDEKSLRTSICGGDTLFEKLAEQAYPDVIVNQSMDDVVNQLTHSSVFSFYGHCEHKLPDRPSLLFKDFVIRDVEMRLGARGAERIELWACQSGSNIPLHFLPSQVNEAFGMDMRMLECGAKTAIGSLWAVPELVTAHIKAKYDKLVISGLGASEALLSAQRWWVERGADDELSRITTIGEQEYLRTLGCHYTKKQALEALMGPVLASSANKSKFDISVLEDSFKHPSAWSGMRFCGLSEQQNVFIPRVELSSAQLQQLNTLILQMDLQAGFVKNAR
ncbi:CHAT domain-containing protein [Shewanella sp. SR43-4]|uniref:CHAT domain-containing protein n=1 Tax=unclassified Shewanella TaxID=196818 RepID=UPI0015F9FA65|nr:CHAT domain-containing protein [Shewanella sp. SR43-4]MBB1318085.1 CHAT domain-containing protein [Shewanella sp. SR43-4]